MFGARLRVPSVTGGECPAIAAFNVEKADLELDVKQPKAKIVSARSTTTPSGKPNRSPRSAESSEEVAKHQAEEQEAGQKPRGRRPGTPGVSHSDKPTFTKEFKPETCGNYSGRTRCR